MVIQFKILGVFEWITIFVVDEVHILQRQFIKKEKLILILTGEISVYKVIKMNETPD